MPTISDVISIKLAVDSTGLLQGYEAAIRDMERANRTLEQQGADLERIAKSVGYGLEKVIAGVAGLFGLVLSFEGFKNLVTDASQAGTSMGRFAESISRTVEQTQAYRQAFSTFGDTSILQAIRRMKLDLSAFPLEYTNWMRRVETLTGKTVRGKEPEQILQDIADAAARRRMDAAHVIAWLQSSLPLTESDVLLLAQPGGLQEAIRKQKEEVGTPTTTQAQAMEHLHADLTNLETVNELLRLQTLTLMEPFLHELITMAVRLEHWIRGIAQMLGIGPLSMTSPALAASGAGVAGSSGNTPGFGPISRYVSPSSQTSPLATGVGRRTGFNPKTGQFETTIVPPGSPYPSQNVTQAIKDAAKASGIPESTLGGIASIESSFDPSSNSNNPGTQYKGLFQMGREEWANYGQGGNIYDAHDNAMAAARMLADHREKFKVKFGRYPTDGELYLIHQQGLGFYTQGTMTNIEGNLPPSAPGWARTHEGFERYWSEKLAERTARYGVGGPADSYSPGGTGQLPDVDARLQAIMSAAAKHLPPGYTIKPTSGYRPGSQGFHSQHLAEDFQIYDPNGNPIANRGLDTTGLYETLARHAYGEMLATHPELKGTFIWGGNFETSAGSGEADLMHFDLGGERGHHFRQSLEQLGVMPGERYGAAAAAQSFDTNRPKVENNETSTHVNQVIVNTHATDATGIAKDVKDAIGKQMETHTGGGIPSAPEHPVLN